MISKKAHSLLSDVHSLLGNYEAADFLDAAQFSPALAGALEILAAKAGSHVPVPASATDSLPARKRSKSHANDRNAPRSTAEEIYELLKRTEHAKSAHSIIALGKRMGINISMNPKDGKSRLLKRLSNGIATLSKDRRSQLLSEVLKTPSSQTQGWISVLKGRG